MASVLDSLRNAFQRTPVAPGKTVGAPGTAIYGGYIQEQEKNPAISSREERYRTYSELMANTSIVAAGTRYFLNLVAKADWSFTPSEGDPDGKYAEMAEEIGRASCRERVSSPV